MDQKRSKIVINDAPSQLGRQLRLLADGDVRVDGRSQADLLDFSIRYGRLINFFDLDDEVDGDWVEFFLSDATTVLGSIEARRLDRVEAAYSALRQSTDRAQLFHHKFRLLRDTFRSVLVPARWVNTWLRGAEMAPKSTVAGQLREALHSEVEASLREQLQALKSYDEGAASRKALGSPIGLDYDGFLPIWKLDDVRPNSSYYAGRTRNQRIDSFLPHLDPIVNSFAESIETLEEFARAHLPATFAEDDHRPQAALYIAFTRLFQHAQKTLNSLAPRYRRFYYRDVLREAPRGPVPDSVFLAFAMANDADPPQTTVPAGTLFPAGLDEEDREILYAADRAIAVSSAALAKIMTLRVVRGPLVPDEASPDEPVVRRLVLSTILDDEDESEESTTEESPPEQEPPEEPAPWPTFGARRANPEKGSTPATLGFALASPYLLLTSGDRTVTVDVNYGERFAREVLMPRLERLAAASGRTPERIFRHVLRRGLELYLSTAAGWLRVERYEVDPVRSPEPSSGSPWPRFRLRFSLPPSAPPIVAYDPAAEEADDSGDSAAVVSDDPRVTASDPAPDLPTLKVYLRDRRVALSKRSSSSPRSPVSSPEADKGERVGIYPISLLGEMDVVGFEVDVEVARLGELQVENTDGEVDTEVPYALFGAQPVVGSYLKVRQPELFSKRVERLWIDVDWFDLPIQKTGFKGYYRDYTLGPSGTRQPDLFDNAKFRGVFSIDDPGNWYIEGERIETGQEPAWGQEVDLFRTRPYSSPPDDSPVSSPVVDSDCDPGEPRPVAPLCPTTAFDDLAIGHRKTPDYYDPAASAIRLELSEPPYAFGNDLYALNVLNSVVEDLPDPDKCEAECQAACEPISRAAAIVGSCIDCIVLADGNEKKIVGCLHGCELRLVALLSVQFARCLLGAGDRESESVTAIERGLRSTYRDGGRPDPSELRDLLQALRDLTASSPGGTARDRRHACLKRCLTILEGLAEVALARAICGTDPDCLEPELAGVQARLEAESTACVQACMEDCVTIGKELKYPNDPYLPQVEALLVDYSASCSIRPEEPSATDGLFFHLTPFGGYTAVPANGAASAPLLPQFANDGNLYLGFTGLGYSQTLTLLFQMTAEVGEVRLDRPEVAWGSLALDGWRPTSPEVDSTNGLRNTGIVTLELPALESGDPYFPGDDMWLHAAADADLATFPETVAIFAHAGLASWVPTSSSGAHLREPLPAGMISSSVEELAAIDTIEQPIESFGGRPREDRRRFRTRVGERLRHKNRALLGWDYERLVLERFPTVWKVRALPARTPHGGGVPANVLVVVVAGPESVEVLDPTVPAATSAQLRAIQDYLEQLVSPFVKLHVVNPVYVRARVTASVKLTDTDATGELLERLDAELVEYLSPWYYSAERAATEGNYPSESDVAAFIRSRPYVESLVSMGPLSYRPNPARLDSDWYFLTSAERHSVTTTSGESPPDSGGLTP